MDIKIKGVVEPMQDPDVKLADDILAMLQSNPGKEVDLDIPGQSKEERLRNVKVFRFSLGRISKQDTRYRLITIKVIDNGNDINVRAAYQERKASVKKASKAPKKTANKQSDSQQQQQ